MNGSPTSVPCSRGRLATLQHRTRAFADHRHTRDEQHLPDGALDLRHRDGPAGAGRGRILHDQPLSRGRNRGAVGIPLCFAQAISVVLYTVGFAESLVSVVSRLSMLVAGRATTVFIAVLAAEPGDAFLEY
jgi:hypothetical protein